VDRFVAAVTWSWSCRRELWSSTTVGRAQPTAHSTTWRVCTWSTIYSWRRLRVSISTDLLWNSQTLTRSSSTASLVRVANLIILIYWQRQRRIRGIGFWGLTHPL